MIVIHARNVGEAYWHGMRLLREKGERQTSRAGDVLVSPVPVTTVYRCPTERVLRDPQRDANPFFHLAEALWMLAGREDAAYLNHYVRNFGERFAEEPDMQFIHGAYGYRWRVAFGVDQLDEVVHKLRDNPADRQAVIAMWDPRYSHYEDLTGNHRDRPCNTHIYLRVRDGALDLTVCCRSNDIVWGAYGANAVHFSVLQEYLAGRIGVGVGVMYQISNNWHGYTDVLDKLWPVSMGTESHIDDYSDAIVCPMPMGTQWDLWDQDLATFMHWHDEILWQEDAEASWLAASTAAYHNSWFDSVAAPMARANWCWRQGQTDRALMCAEAVWASDWQRAAAEWLSRRRR
jgi:hypothetical protein